MNEPKFTPGPWTLDDEACNVVHEPSGSVIARYFEPDDFPCLEGGTPEVARAEVELPANARLIAAAPDLFAAADNLLSHNGGLIDGIDGPYVMVRGADFDAIQAAHAKATEDAARSKQGEGM